MKRGTWWSQPSGKTPGALTANATSLSSGIRGERESEGSVALSLGRGGIMMENCLLWWLRPRFDVALCEPGTQEVSLNPYWQEG